MFPRRLTVLPLALIVLPGIAGARDTLNCPDGTRADGLAIDEHKKRFEYCTDIRTGLKEGVGQLRDGDGRLLAEWQYRGGKRHGAQRLYDEAGTAVISESTYEQGEELSYRLTLAGLQDIARKQSETAAAEGDAWRVTVLDEHTLRYEVTLLAERSSFQHEVPALRERLLSRPRFCALFAIPGADIQKVVAMYIDTEGALLSEIPLRRAECTASPSAK